MSTKRFSSNTRGSSLSGAIPPTLEYVIVGGGGGAPAYYSAGGGGAGGYRSSVQGESSGGGASAEAPFQVSAGVTYNIIVGRGGRGTTGDNSLQRPENGGKSAFANIVAYGGGAGGCQQAGAEFPEDGGSGGGQRNSANNAPGGLGISGQGYRGGNSIGTSSYGDPNYPGSGGGGAGGAGGDVSTTTTSTNGGIGVQSSITGVATYYAGGGGGSAQNGGTSGNGGLGGGGNAGSGAGNKGYPGQPGESGKGGGGGAGNRSIGGNGGSGVVILRYPVKYAPATRTTGNPIVTVANGYRVYRYLGNGSITFGESKETPSLYTKDELFLDFDAADLTYSDGAAISSGTTLTTRGVSEIPLVTGGTLTYRTSSGGHLDFGSAAGYARFLASQKYKWTELNRARSVSLVCWFKSDQTSRQCLLSRFNANDTAYSNPVYQFNHIVDPTGDYHYNSAGVISGAAGDLNTNSWSANTWTLSVWTYDVLDGTARWYQNNGNLITSTTPGNDNTEGLSVEYQANTPIGLGTRGDVFETLRGQIAIARVYTKALSVAEIQQEYNSFKTRFGLS